MATTGAPHDQHTITGSASATERVQPVSDRPEAVDPRTVDPCTVDPRTVDPRVTGPIGFDPATPQTGRAQAPIRWPHPDRTSLALVGVWAVGVVVALFVPASLVSPTAVTAPAGRVWLAFGATLVGAVVMFVGSFGLYRRSRDAAVLILGGVPAAACVIGGIIFTAAKLTGM